MNAVRYRSAVLALLAAAGVAAQPVPQATVVPDLTGRWAPATCVPDGATCPFDVESLPLTRAGRNLMNAFEEPLGPKFDCVQATVPSLLADPYRWALHQLTDRVVFEYEKDDIVRTVWLDGWEHPEPGPYDASWQGYSRGHYEGDTLVVVTDRFLYDPTGLEDLGGIPSSTLKRVTERYRREGNRLIADVTTEDPLILTAPVEFRFEWVFGEEPLILPYGCALDQARRVIQYAQPDEVPNLRSSGQSEPTRGGVPVGGRE
jgi:hypothetical protein